MELTINRKTIEVAPGGTTLAELLERESLDGPGRAVAVDNQLVPRDKWAATALSEGMKITVIRAVCGG